MDIQILISQMIQLFLVIIIGYIIYKLKVVDDNFTNKFSRLILDVTMPCMVLGSVLKLEESQALSNVLTALFVAIAMFFVILPIIGWILAKILFVKENQVSMYVFMNSFSNVGFMGFPIINSLCGSTGLFYAAIFNLIFNLSIYTLGVWLISRNNSEKTSFNIKQLLSPGVILSSLALVIYFARLDFPVIIDDTVSLIGSITSPSAMLLIGCSLARIDFKNIFNDWRLYVWTLIKQVALPLLLWMPFNLIIKNELVLYVTYILFSMPVANSAVLFATNYNGDEELAAKTVFLTTVFSLVTVPLCLLIVT